MAKEKSRNGIKLTSYKLLKTIIINLVNKFHYSINHYNLFMNFRIRILNFGYSYQGKSSSLSFLSAGYLSSLIKAWFLSLWFSSSIFPTPMNSFSFQAVLLTHKKINSLSIINLILICLKFHYSILNFDQRIKLY